jgi:hypothetical protein
MNANNIKIVFAHATAIGIDDVMKDDTQRHALVKEFSEGNYESLKDMPDKKLDDFKAYLVKKYPPPPRSLLPTRKTPPQTELTSQTILAYGPPKVGKSTFFSKSDGALFIKTEDGLKHLEAFETTVSSWVEFLNICKEISGGDHKFKTIILDTVDNLCDMCSDYICKQQGIKHESDLEWGKGYALVNEELSRVLTKLSLMPYGLVMISHVSVKKEKGRTGEFSKSDPDMPKGARKVIRNMSDFILFFDFESDEGDKRVIRTKPNQHYDAGDRSGKLPETMDMDYDIFIKEYKKTMGLK